jgi:hypothetical protein
MTQASVLARETAHLSQADRDLIQRRLVVGIELAIHFPAAPERALTDKLQSFGDCPRWVCELVAREALAVAPDRPHATLAA